MWRLVTALDIKPCNLTSGRPINEVATGEPVKSLSWDDESGPQNEHDRGFRRNCSPRCQGSWEPHLVVTVNHPAPAKQPLWK
ncbi:hypothetical protein FBZ98_104146 [Rhizobium sp. ERR 922]|nr:hypothetical protein FBZ98_104146 [Rhizobium sp. ERR 922]TWB95816.1 hypothetical protein FBZ97_104504 [Rhizobium sp. ERR 942]